MKRPARRDGQFIDRAQVLQRAGWSVDGEDPDRRPPRAQRIQELAPAELMAMSRLVEPRGWIPTTVPSMGASAPLAEIAKPEIEGVAELET